MLHISICISILAPHLCDFAGLAAIRIELCGWVAYITQGRKEEEEA